VIFGGFSGLDFMGKEGEDFAGLAEVSGEGEKKRRRSFRRGLERKYWRKKKVVVSNVG
jgi:hypothetical protein